MSAIQTNDWIVLNSIIYDIYTTKNFASMRYNFLKKMKMVFDFDAADFHLVGPKANELCEGVFFNCSNTDCSKFDSIDYSRGILYSGKSLVYRETDIIPDEQRIQTDYYKKVYKPNRWHYALQMILAYQGHFLGVVTFYRNIGKQDFVYEDVFLADTLKDHLTWRLHRQKEFEKSHHDTFSIEELTKKYDLTKQEHRVLELMMHRMSNAEICEELSITINTLKKHTLNIYRKLNINSRLELFKLIKGTQ